MSAGGANGGITLPPQIDAVWRILMYGDTEDAAETDWLFQYYDVFNDALGEGGNPFESVVLYSPRALDAITEDGSDLDLIQDQIVALRAKLNALVTNPTTLLGTFLTDVIARANAGTIWKEVGKGSVEVASIRGAERVTQFVEDFRSGINPNVDWAEFIDAVVAKIDEEGVRTTLDLEDLVSQALAAAEVAFTAILAAASDALNDPSIAAAVAAFETRIQNAKGRAVRDFSGGMADINAVNSSAFIFGRALIESDVLADIARFETELQGRVYLAALQSFGNVHGGLIGSFLQAGQGDVRARDALLTTSVQAISGLLQQKITHTQAATQLFTQAFLGEMSERLRVDLTNSQLEAGAIERYTEALFRYTQHNVQAEDTFARLFAEVKRQKIVAIGEHEDRNLDLDEKHALWPFEVYHRSMNLLAAPSGMAGNVPPRPSRAQSALGGMATLMGAAAMVPGIGVPAALGIGVLGGLAGLLG